MRYKMVIVRLPIPESDSWRFRSAFPTRAPLRSTSRSHTCKNHHMILSGDIASRFYETEATREKNIQETQRSSWEGKKPQLHTNVHVLRQASVAQSTIQERPENRSRSKVIKKPADSDSSGSSRQSSNEDKKQRTWRERIHKGVRIWREKILDERSLWPESLSRMPPEVSRDAQVRLPNECHGTDPSGFQAHSVNPREDIWQYVYSEATLREAEVFLDSLEEWDF